MHGSSPAAWTAVLMCLAGTLIGGIALIPEPHWVWFTVGCVIAVGSGLVGRAMAAAGFGVSRADGDSNANH
ncbi:HGxxPAAW family protein [Aeromicrobium sp.]|uniref:HGxxPAAW family protein n=1 Tax=Aeromicrobium sp. TaxID=1871063 RepID=UPI0030C146EC